MLREVKNTNPAASPDLREVHRSYELVGCNAPILDISIFRGRGYKDGTHQYMIYLCIPSAKSREIITLDKVRGTMEDAELRANEILGFASTK